MLLVTLSDHSGPFMDVPNWSLPAGRCAVAPLNVPVRRRLLGTKDKASDDTQVHCRSVVTGKKQGGVLSVHFTTLTV